MLKSLIREPLLHFLLLALAIFAIYDQLGDGKTQAPDSIVVTAPKIEQMAGLFTKTWQRAPTSDELKGLIDDYVKEEVLVRQALSLGLDRDDTVVRRRLRQKMEFLNAVEAEELQATDAELEAYLAANPDAFAFDGMLAFQQVFLNAQQRGGTIEQDAAAILELLQTNPEADRSLLGDTTLLPPDLPLAPEASIREIFGAEFTDALGKAIVGQWTGPIVSTFGYHLLRVVERKPGRVPALGEVRDAVQREWTNARRKSLDDQRFAELLKGYVVSIESATGEGASQ